MALKSSGGWKKTIAFIFFLLAGFVVGSVVAILCEQVSWLAWLSWSRTIGIGSGAPVVLDLVVATLTFGFSLNVSIAQIFFAILFIFLFNKTCRNM